MPHPTTTILTRRAVLRVAGGALGLTGAALLAACGGAKPTPPASAPPSAPSSAIPSGAASAATGAETLPPVDGIPQGRTPEGFPVLGAMEAKVTLVDYSDFL